MKNTNPKQLRAEMRDYLELAAKEPIRIQRRAGDSYILVNETTFMNMKDEIVSLQRRLLGMSEALSGQVQEYKVGDRSRTKRLTRKS